MKTRKLLLSLLALAPVSSVSFAAKAELMATNALQPLSVDEMANLFEKRFFSSEFYNLAAEYDVRTAEDLKSTQRNETMSLLLKTAEKEIASAKSEGGSMSPK